YKSVDEGKTWMAQSQGLNNMDIRSIAVASGLIVAGTAQGVYCSTDSATSRHSLGLESLDIAAVEVLPGATGSTVFAGADNGTAGSGFLLKSEGLGGSWAAVKGNFPTDAVVASLPVAPAPSGGTDSPVLARTSQGLFRRDDRGATWSPPASPSNPVSRPWPCSRSTRPRSSPPPGTRPVARRAPIESPTPPPRSPE